MLSAGKRGQASFPALFFFFLVIRNWLTEKRGRFQPITKRRITCKTKATLIYFYSTVDRPKGHFQIKGFALALKRKHKVTQKWSCNYAPLYICDNGAGLKWLPLFPALVDGVLSETIKIKEVRGCFIKIYQQRKEHNQHDNRKPQLKRN